MKDTKHWIIVASRDHVQRGVSEGFAQVCHGKLVPLKRMKPGDWVIYYSPKSKFSSNETCQVFTAIGKINNDLPYQHKMGEDFMPYRRNVTFLDCKEIPIRPLIPNLTFIKNKRHWGYMFRFGFFEIKKEDFDLISGTMLPNGDEVTAYASS